MDNFCVGFARELITPPIGTLLYGYSPDVVSESINDDLEANAVAFSFKGKKVIMISATVCLIATELCEYLRKEISKENNIDFENVIISATHTHSAPNVAGVDGWGDFDEEYCKNIFIPKILSAAKMAILALTPAKVGVSTTDSNVGINRRQILQNGEISLGQNPFGVYDKKLTCIAFKSQSGELLGNIIHYCSHGTAAGKNTEITKDWSGIMTEHLERETGVISVFFNGAEGDIGPRLSNGSTTGDIEYVKELGSLAAIDAIRAYKQIKTFCDVEFETITDEIKIPYCELPSIDFIKEKLSEYENKDIQNLINIDKRTYSHWMGLYDFIKSGRNRREYFTFKQTLIKIGNIVFVPFPFEVFVEITLRIRDYSKFEHTLCLSNTNGVNSYLPTQTELCRGGYEVCSFMTNKEFTLAPNADQHIIDENMRLLKKFER